MTWVELEDAGCCGPGVADGFEGRSPSKRFEVLGKIVCRDERQDVSLEAIEVWIVERLDGGFLDGAVHAFGLAVGSRMVGFGQSVLDVMLVVDAIEDVRAEVSPGWSVAVFRQVGEGHAVVGQHDVDRVGVAPCAPRALTTPRRNSAPPWRRARHASQHHRGTRPSGKLRDTVDGQAQRAQRCVLSLP